MKLVPSFWSLILGFVALAPFAICQTAQAATLSASVFVFGTKIDADWEIDIDNSNAFALTNASISSASLTQTVGAATTPRVLTSLPLSLGTIAANSTAVADLDIDFLDTGLSALFDLNAVFNADGLTASLFFPNFPPFPEPMGPLLLGPFPATVTITSATPAVPEPATWVMTIVGLAGIGFMAHRRKSALMAA